MRNEHSTFGNPEDEPSVLESMMRSLDAAPVEYRPTKYWANNQAELVSYLHERGLADFRSVHSTGARNILMSFGATDLWRDEWTAPQLERRRLVSNRLVRKIPGAPGLVETIARAQRRLHGRKIEQQYAAYGAACLSATSALGRLWGAKPLEDLELSMIGNPEDRFSFEGRWWSPTMLNFYMRYAWCSQYVDFDEIESYVELGSGSGKQAEVVAKLHPEVTLYLYDIPPQLYVAYEYLRAALPGRVAPFGGGMVREPGVINVLPAWDFAELEVSRNSLFWNAASFQEMEPEVVSNYLATVRKSGVGSVYLMEIMAGVQSGVERPTTSKVYEEALEGYKMLGIGPSLLCDGRSESGYSDAFWARESDA